MRLIVNLVWILTLGVVLRLNGYKVPFLHHLESTALETAPAIEQPQTPTEPEAVPQELPPENPIAADFANNYWTPIP